MFENKITSKDICFIGVSTAFLAIFAQISIPMPLGVPITLQSFSVALSAVVLGSRKGAFSALIYVILGAIGLPVFSNFTGGLFKLIGPTGGFILSFPLMAWIIGWFSSKKSKYLLALGLSLGTLINFISGMIMFSFVTKSNLYTAFTVCVLPFIPTSIIQIVSAGILGAKIKKRIRC